MWIKKKSGIVNDESVLSLNFLVDDIQTKIPNNFIIVDSAFISHKKCNVDDPNTRQRYATIIPAENNSRDCNYIFHIHWVVYFQVCNTIDTIKSQGFEGVIHCALIEPHDSAVCLKEITSVCESNDLDAVKLNMYAMSTVQYNY